MKQQRLIKRKTSQARKTMFPMDIKTRRMIKTRRSEESLKQSAWGLYKLAIDNKFFSSIFCMSDSSWQSVLWLYVIMGHLLIFWLLFSKSVAMTIIQMVFSCFFHNSLIMILNACLLDNYHILLLLVDEQQTWEKGSHPLLNNRHCSHNPHSDHSPSENDILLTNLLWPASIVDTIFLCQPKCSKHIVNNGYTIKLIKEGVGNSVPQY
jgi:hypothetical protein